MKKLYKIVSVCFLFISFSTSIYAQNEFYIKGDNLSSGTNPEVFVNGTDGVNPTLFVNGEIVNNQGQFINDSSEIELTGDFTNTADGVHAFYESNGIERFSGNDTSAIRGDFSDTTANLNQFYNLKINKVNNTDYVELHTDVNVNKEGTLDFEGNGIITTDGSNHGGDGEDYDNVLFVRNDTVIAITGHSVGNGADNKYVEGKLKRQVKVGNYFFPIGVDKDIIDGMEALQITANSDFSSAVLAYVKDEGSTILPSTITTYADLGTHPNNGMTGLDFSNAVGACGSGDGILDRVELTEGQSHSWVVSPDSTGAYNYDIEFFPGVVLESSVSFYTCGALELKYLSKDDVPGGSITASGPGLPTFTAPGYYASPNGSNKLIGQTSFSTLRNMGPVLNGTTLPVELVSLTAYGVENSYINVDWVTASEVNNEGFEIQRSINGVDFKSIGFINGNGNSTEVNDYSYVDYEVQKNVVYYYRLKQIDFNGEYEITDLVSASLKGDQDFNVNVYPNPLRITDEITVEIQSSFDSKADLKIFDVVGQLILFENVKLSKGINQYQINNNTFAAGQYFVVVNMSEKQFTKNIMVLDK